MAAVKAYHVIGAHAVYVLTSVYTYHQCWSVSCFQPVVDQATLEEYLQVERELGEARRADPQVLSQLELKTEALDKMTQKVERLERHYGDLEALA